MIEVARVSYPWITCVSFPRLGANGIAICTNHNIPGDLRVARSLSAEEKLHWNVKLTAG